ncbi:hypothetical protein CFT13S00388_09875, partial [Campylobacter fetus subsp. testudinum]
VNNKSVEKACFRATQSGKKICTIKSHICNFVYVDGIGRGGKVLQIWLDDEIASFPNDVQNNKGCNNESNFDTRACGILETKGLQGSSICETRQGEYQSGE